MNRGDLIRHLESHGCYLLREGGKHSIYINPANNQTTSRGIAKSRSFSYGRFVAT